MCYKTDRGIVPPFGVYVATRNSGDAYHTSRR